MYGEEIDIFGARHVCVSKLRSKMLCHGTFGAARGWKSVFVQLIKQTTIIQHGGEHDELKVTVSLRSDFKK